MTNRIAKLLHDNGNIGAANGIKLRDLLKLLGIPQTNIESRKLKAEIRGYRCQWQEADGIENYIVSDTAHGYYLPLDADEAIRFLSIQDKRAKETFFTVKTLRQHLKEKGMLNT